MTATRNAVSMTTLNTHSIVSTICHGAPPVNRMPTASAPFVCGDCVNIVTPKGPYNASVIVHRDCVVIRAYGSHSCMLKTVAGVRVIYPVSWLRATGDFVV